MKCPQCQAETVAGSLYCPKCGSQLPAHDPADVPSIGEMPTLRAGAQSRRWKTGEKVLGRYRILGELGQGGMGIVYKCFDEIGGIEVALKALPPELSHNSVEMEEVRENFQLVARLVHQYIAAVRTLDRDSQTGDYYLILELAEGVDLRRWRKQKGGKVSLEEVLPILRHVAEALDYAHTRKIIHRDVKPANVMVAPDGAVKVLDFGLAAQIQTSLSRVSQAKYGTSGTGPYMAPEQWRGQYQDGASDQYALAVLAYELLSGHLPFENADAVVLQQAVLNLAPEAVAGLQPPAWNVLHRGLAKERAARYGSCGELVAALAGAEAEIRNPKPETRKKAEIRKPKSQWVVAAAAVLLAAGLTGWYFGIQRPQQAAEKSRKGELARLEAQARSANDAKEKARAEQDQRERERLVSGTVVERQTLRLAGTLAKQPYPAAGEKWENSLGMKFAPVAGTEVLFCVWETRVRDFEAFANASGHDATSGMYSLKNGSWGTNGHTWKSPGFSQGPTHPVCGVSWEDAQAFCEWLSKKERAEGKISAGQSYRLPREVEWNQAVGSTKYPWGDEWPPPSGAGNYAGSEAKDENWPSNWTTIEGYRDNYARTAPVGSFAANRYGLCDLGGNVWEWCEDWYDSNQKSRVSRGASWLNDIPDVLLSSYRSGNAPGARRDRFGFRCVLVVGSSP